MEEKGINNKLIITYFTDPLCCWSWGMQPHLDSLQVRYGDRFNIKYLMGGMLPSWQQFHDEANAVSRPAQMGPVWMHAAQLTGRPVYHQLWVKDPPASSYPSCIAVKCVQRQSPAMGITFFKRLQQAVMEEGQNMTTWPAIQTLASAFAAACPAFNLYQFKDDYLHGAGINDFRQDLAIVAQHQITRFPTLIMETQGCKRILVAGYRTSDRLVATIQQAFPGLFSEEVMAP